MSAILKLAFANWQLVLIAGLTVTCMFLVHLWQSEVTAFEVFREEVKVQGRVAKQLAIEQEKRQEEIRQEVSDEWRAKLPELEKVAVQRYVARFGRVRNDAGSCGMPGAAKDSQGAGATIEEPVAAGCEPEFINACAEDALARKLVAEWAKANGIKGE